MLIKIFNQITQTIKHRIDWYYVVTSMILIAAFTISFEISNNEKMEILEVAKSVFYAELVFVLIIVVSLTGATKNTNKASTQQLDEKHQAIVTAYKTGFSDKKQGIVNGGLFPHLLTDAYHKGLAYFDTINHPSASFNKSDAEILNEVFCVSEAQRRAIFADYFELGECLDKLRELANRADDVYIDEIPLPFREDYSRFIIGKTVALRGHRTVTYDVKRYLHKIYNHGTELSIKLKV